MLWIAFNFGYLCDITQQLGEIEYPAFSCELLSILDIFVI